MKPQPNSSKRHAAMLFSVAGLLAIVGSLSVLAIASAGTTAPQGWRQSGPDGLGDAENVEVAMAVFNNQLYAGTWHSSIAQLWRTSDGQSWTEFTTGWPVSNTTILDLEPFQSNLYVGVDSTTGAQLWRTDGTTWEMVVSNGFTSTANLNITALAVFSNTLYAVTANTTPAVEVWRSSTGNNGSWTLVHSAEADDSAWFNGFATVEVFDGYLYLGISDNNLAQLWRTNDGLFWQPVFTNGLGNANNVMVGSMAEFQGAFYLGLRNTIEGGELWRSSNGTNWTNVFTGGLGDVSNGRPYGLINYRDDFYLVFANTASGAEVWRSPDGSEWTQILSGGWGDPNNKHADYLDKAAEIFGNSLYIGTGNDVTGLQIWQLLHQLYLPLIMRH